MQIEIKKLEPDQWSQYSEDAHRAMFSELKPAYMDRIDYALLAVDPGSKGVLGYITVRELDSNAVYWQYGGAFPTIKGTAHVLTVYTKFVEMARQQYKRILTIVESTNIPYLKLAMKLGFRIVGVRMFKQSVLVEMLLDFEEGGQYAI